MDWFRVYNDITKDRKLRRHRPSIRWAWIAVLCIANNSPQRGILLLSDDIPATVEDIADEAALSVTETEEALSIFVKQGMIKNIGDVWKVINWNKRQFARDNSSERVKRFRSKQEKYPVTVTETPCNGYKSVSETPPEYRVQSTENNPPTPLLFSEHTQEAINEVETTAAELVVAFHAVYPEHRKKYSTGGAIKANDEFAQRLKDGWTKEEILNRINLNWPTANGPPAPWEIFGNPPDDVHWGPGHRHATEDEFNAWALTQV